MAFHVFEYDVEVVALPLQLVYLGNPSMGKRAGRAGLLLESLAPERIARHLRRQGLDRHLPAQALVFGQVHNTHAAAPEFTQYPVLANGHADHVRG
jgi:hypothetical protein